jgi:hypothetical protein
MDSIDTCEPEIVQITFKIKFLCQRKYKAFQL